MIIITNKLLLKILLSPFLMDIMLINTFYVTLQYYVDIIIGIHLEFIIIPYIHNKMFYKSYKFRAISFTQT